MRKKLEEYTSVIPPECIEKIIEAKKPGLFDEIIIIYTRRHDKPVELDKKKKSQGSREKVDPICFGRINETGRLFFICDWLDDECDFDMKKLQSYVKVEELVKIEKK